MQRFIPSEGFGENGLTVDSTGANWRFRRPMSKVKLINTTNAAVYYGINKIVSDAGKNSDIPAGTNDDERVGVITLADARKEGNYLPANGTEEIEAPVDAISGRRGIYSIWFYCGSSATIKGGSTGI